MGQGALNPLQRQAVDHRNGPALVLAGPGTGKTRVLEERTVALVQEGLFPAGIALLTFTRKAADENRRRIAARLPGEVADQLQVSTLHALALRVLVAARRKRRCEIAEVVDPAACYDYLRRALSELSLDPNLYPPLSVWRRLVAWKAGERDLNMLDPPVRRLFERYGQILAAENKWDLADLVANALEVLQVESDLAAAFRSVRFLMVDEFQDTALPEYQFLQAILGENRNLFCVGAVAQSIYAWRGADARELLERFERDYPEVRKIILRQNYRSGARIIQAAASMTLEEREVYLSSENGPGQVLLKECPNHLAEAHLVAGLIRELRERDSLAWPDFAVLMRGWSQAGPVEQAFIDQDVPYAVYGEQSRYYERREVRALYAYLRGALAVSGKSTNGRPESASMEGALEMLINTPARGIGPRSMQMIRGKLPEITWEALVGATVRDDLREQVRSAASGLLHLLLRLGRLSDTLTPAEMIAQVIRETGWEQALADELDGKSILRALRAFQDESDQYATLEAFVQAMKKKIKSDLVDQGVALSTIHAAKGLEWPAVFVVGLNQGVLPSAQSLQTAEKGDPVEERHVAHVAFSRARQLLMLTWARERLEPSGRTRALRPSEFLGRLPKEAVDEFATIHSIDTLRSAAEPGAAHDPADLLPGGGAQPEEIF